MIIVVTVSAQCILDNCRKITNEVNRHLRDDGSSATVLDEIESTIYNGGVVTASHTGLHSANYDERFIYAMDGSTSNKYYVEDADVAAGTVNVWVQWASIDNVPVIYNRLRFFTGGESNRRPKYLSVQASHGNDVWDVLWESSSVSLSYGDNYFSFVNDEAYPIYRIYMGHPTSQGVEVRELGLSWRYIPNWSTLRGAFTASHEGYHSGNYDERYTKAFDDNKQTKYSAIDTPIGQGNEAVWIQMQANNEKRYVFNHISFYAGNESHRRPRNITVLASNGEDIWTVLSSKTFSWSSSDGWDYHEDWSFENTEAYNIYRVSCREPESEGIEIAEITLSNALVADVPAPAVHGDVELPILAVSLLSHASVSTYLTPEQCRSQLRLPIYVFL